MNGRGRRASARAGTPARQRGNQRGNPAGAGRQEGHQPARLQRQPASGTNPRLRERKTAGESGSRGRGARPDGQPAGRCRKAGTGRRNQGGASWSGRGRHGGDLATASVRSESAVVWREASRRSPCPTAVSAGADRTAHILSGGARHSGGWWQHQPPLLCAGWLAAGRRQTHPNTAGDQKRRLSSRLFRESSDGAALPRSWLSPLQKSLQTKLFRRHLRKIARSFQVKLKSDKIIKFI